MCEFTSCGDCSNDAQACSMCIHQGTRSDMFIPIPKPKQKVIKLADLEYQKQTGKPSEEEVWLSCYTAILSNSTYDFDSANIYATEACETYTRKFKQNSHSKPI